MALPILDRLNALCYALSQGCNAVLIAPPGAGKTTVVAPALLQQHWCTGQILLLSPRRVAARAAAERMADALGERAGETIGYLTRLDSKQGPKTRILVVTEAIFVNRILADPELAGVSAVLFDEAHERHLDSDLGLALAIESQSVLRPDLRLLVMSATLDGARFARLLHDAPVIESEGKAYPLALRWLGARPELRLEDAMADAIVQAWRETGDEADILAFLPGVGEISRTAERLAMRLPQALVLPLHGQCKPAAQRAAIRRDPNGLRRIVLATAIAETSLTLDGVSVVVDCGLARQAEFDVAAGVTRLVTRRASQAAATQRAGRAARQGPGIAYRLWEEAAHAGRPAFSPPEILNADLAPLRLALAQWGAGDVGAMAWLDPPPEAAWSAAKDRLLSLGAVEQTGGLTALGKQIASLPMEPWQAAMLLFGAERGDARLAARLVLLLQERGLGEKGEDLSQRLVRWSADRSARADNARKLADGWAKRAAALVQKSNDDDDPQAGVLLAMALPANLARRRDASGEHWLSVSGRGYMLDPASPLASAEWLAIGDAQGTAKGARITAALALDAAAVERNFATRIERVASLEWNGERIEPRVSRRLGAVKLASGPDPAPDAAAITAMLIARLRIAGLTALPFSPASQQLRNRAKLLGLEVLGDDALLADAEQWLAPVLSGKRSLQAVSSGALHDALLARLDWMQSQQLEQRVPTHFQSPEGSRHAIDYGAEAGPMVEVRVQALFGLDVHPAIGNPPVPLVLSLTSPAGRPIQTTRDLPGFWRGSWKDVQRDMKGRYPRHRWPDTPWTEIPSLKTRKRLEQG